eukprot:1183356-Prorocentrum_minimum.AAC.2
MTSWKYLVLAPLKKRQTNTVQRRHLEVDVFEFLKVLHCFAQRSEMHKGSRSKQEELSSEVAKNE